MSLIWYLAGIASGALLYHNIVPWVIAKTGQSRSALQQVVRGLTHDSFLNLKWAVEQETRRRRIDPSED